MARSCPLCEGFHWIPKGEKPGWYQRDWRILLDPKTVWLPCPACGSKALLSCLAEEISRILLARLDLEAAGWHNAGQWRLGVVAGGQRIWRWRDMACLPPGPDNPDEAWILISALGGVLRGLDAARLRYLLDQAGAPAMPSTRGEPPPRDVPPQPG